MVRVGGVYYSNQLVPVVLFDGLLMLGPCKQHGWRGVWRGSRAAHTDSVTASEGLGATQQQSSFAKCLAQAT